MFSISTKTVAVLDIGSSKIVAVVAEKLNNKVSILGIGKAKSFGIKNSIITNDRLLSSAISNAIYEAEKMAKKNVDQVVVNVSNIFINSTSLTVRSTFSGSQISPKDMKRIKNIVFSKIDIIKNEVLKYKAFKHDLDDMKSVVDPEFMFANHMISYVHLVTIPLKYLVSIGSALLLCQLKVSKFVLSSEASASVCLTEEEKHGGCILIDMGFGVSDYAVYDGGNMVMCGTIPFAGANITKDISKYFNLGFDEANHLKESVIDLGRDYVEVKEFINLTKIDTQELKIDLGILNKIVAARFYEIVNLIFEKVKEKRSHKHCTSKIIFTGGTSNLKGLNEFIAKKMGAEVRVATPECITKEDLSKISNDPSHSTTLGLLKHTNYLDQDIPSMYKGAGLKRFLLWIKQSF